MTAGAPANTGAVTRRGAWWSLLILSILYVFSFIDRSALSLYVDPIKSNLALSDTQFSLVTGAAFALFYSTLALPIAAWSDRHSRKWIIVSGVAIWGVMTIGCGLASGFALLFLMRMGVGLGEAALTPNAWAIVAENFARAAQGRAMALFVTGGVIGSGLALIAPGLITGTASMLVAHILPAWSSLAAWRLTLIGLGVMTVAMCVPALFILDSRRAPPISVAERRRSTFESIAVCWHNRRNLAGLFVAGPLLNAVAIGTMIWLPAFYMRNRGWSIEEAGYTLGSIFVIAGLAGTVIAGVLADRLRIAQSANAALKLVAVTSIMSVPFLAAAIFFENTGASIACLILALTLSNFMSTLLPLALQAQAPENLRAEVAALFLLVANIAGYGLGPTLPALLSDYAFKDIHAIGLGILVVATLGTALGVVVIGWSGRSQLVSQTAVSQ